MACWLTMASSGSRGTGRRPLGTSELRAVAACTAARRRPWTATALSSTPPQAVARAEATATSASESAAAAAAQPSMTSGSWRCELAMRWFSWIRAGTAASRVSNSHISSMPAGLAPPAPDPCRGCSSRLHAAGSESAGSGSSARASSRGTALRSCIRVTALRRSPLQATAMASLDSGSAPGSSRRASSSRVRTTCACLGQMPMQRLPRRSASSSPAMASPHVKMIGCGDARAAGANLSFKACMASSGRSKSTTEAFSLATSIAVRCLLRRFSRNFCPSRSSRLCSITLLPARRPTSRAPLDFPQPGRPLTRAAGGTRRLPASPQLRSHLSSSAQGLSGLSSLRDPGACRSHQFWPRRTRLQGDIRSSPPCPAWSSARASASRAPRVSVLKDFFLATPGGAATKTRRLAIQETRSGRHGASGSPKSGSLLALHCCDALA
mmetsp:Transcript_24147/g.69697  ORF Transcript_24147/g.69697 Transcript_24147/m.69697 type:complete len:438 (-) Transcript_24147:540-1853(-)